jgi:8-oxo-dGTP pyrophosphatase MutT (NUDIX family)
VRWTVHGERTLYDSDWVRLTLADVEVPGGERFEHHVVRVPREAAATVVRDAERGVLLLWRHRFIVDAWGWELPGGEIDDGETPKQAAVRETVEETGWRPAVLRPLGSYHPFAGRCDQTFHLFVADGAERVGEPASHEADRVEWLPVDEVRRLVADGEIADGYTLTALAWAFVRGDL